jgi:LysM domain
MSAMPAEAEPHRTGQGAVPPIAGPEPAEPSVADALEVKVRGTVRAAEVPAAPDGAAQTRWAKAMEGQAPKAGTREAEVVEAGAAQAETPEPGTAGAAHGRTLRALHPATVRPRQPGPMPSPPRRRPRPAGLRPRRISTRLHPTGVRACSGVVSAQLPAAALPVPQARPSLPGDVPHRLRLTRRGRVVLAVFAAVVVSLIGLAAANGTRAAGSAVTAGTAGHSMTRIVVQPGQTLWTIAMRADPQADPRQVVQQIIAANALRGGSIQAGQRLLVPRG